jgi:hypothetical protein
LETFRQKLPEHRASIAVIQELIDDESPSERRASTVKLAEIAENHEKQQKQDNEYHKAQEEVIKMFEELLPSTEESRHMSTQEMLEQLEDDLVRRGSTREQAGEKLFPITKALLIHPIPTRPNLATTRLPAFKLDIFDPASRTTAGKSADGSRCGDFVTQKKGDGPASSPGTRIPSVDNLSASLDG